MLKSFTVQASNSEQHNHTCHQKNIAFFVIKGDDSIETGKLKNLSGVIESFSFNNGNLLEHR